MRRHGGDDVADPAEQAAGADPHARRHDQPEDAAQEVAVVELPDPRKDRAQDGGCTRITHLQITRSPDHPITRSPDRPIARSPDHPITRFPDSPISKFPDPPHPCLSACCGSMRVTRCTGIQAAVSPTRSMSAEMPPSTSGSAVVISQNMLLNARLSPKPPATPSTTPITIGRIDWACSMATTS